MNVYLAADHAGFALKEHLKPFLASLGCEVEDCGAPTLITDDDYPDYVAPCARKVAADPGSFGVIIGASGQGEAMVANRVPGVRAAVYYGEPPSRQVDAEGHELSMLESVREHNEANILSLAARFLTEDEAKEAVRQFLAAPASDDPRHVRRRQKIG